MRVLITNNTLRDRAGSELYARDVAIELLRRGHAPVLFSTVIGAMADELRSHTLPVIDDLSKLGEAPDVIHGHHHLETTIAAMHFPSVPVVNFCHGWYPWEEIPVKLPSVRRYVAVDETCRDRLISENGIAPERIVVIPNFVDTARFSNVRTPEKTARRALVFSNYANDDTIVPDIRAACGARDIQLDVVGAAAGTATSRPEAILPNYDIVFAKGRCALEAMASGAAVILIDVCGLGEMVTEENVRKLRRLNFGVRTLNRPPNIARLTEEIDRYDAKDAVAVSAFIRDDALVEVAVDRLLAVYQASIAEVAPPNAHAAMATAGSAYLRWLAPLVKESRYLKHRLEQTERLLAERDASIAALQLKR